MRGLGSKERHGRGPPAGDGALRVLISFAPEYRLYGDAFFRELRRVRPDLSALPVPLPRAEEAAACFRPQLVISDGDAVAGEFATVRVPSEPTEASTMRIGDAVRTVVNPSFDDLLAFVDEVGRSVAGWPDETRRSGVREDKHI